MVPVSEKENPISQRSCVEKTGCTIKAEDPQLYLQPVAFFYFSKETSSLSPLQITKMNKVMSLLYDVNT